MNESKFKKLQNQLNKNNCDKCLHLEQQMDRFVPLSPILNFYKGTGTDSSNRRMDFFKFEVGKGSRLYSMVVSNFDKE